MIRREDLLEAIAECEGVRNPTSSTCIKLAAYYTILNQMHDATELVPKAPEYSFASAPEIPFTSSEFSQLVKSKGIEKAFPILEEAMQALYVCNERMYKGIIRQLESI